MLFSAFVLSSLLPTAFGQLNDLAKAAGLKYFGTAVDNNELTDTAYVKILSNVAEFGQITPGNPQKWDVTEPNDGSFTFAQGDVITSMAERNSQLIRCHLLIWHNQLPTWVSGGIWTNETLQAVMKTHITTEMKHYKGQCYAWDVVNEALDDDGNFRTDVFYNVMGEDYIRIAFETAALADPSVKLYYNDYNIEYAGAKATAALALVTKLVNEGVKIDGVGLQGHFVVGSMPLHADFITTMQTYTALGLEVAFTELDIRTSLPSIDALLAQQSLDFENVVSACVEVDNCIGITVWGFDDKYSWVPSTFPGLGAACLFDKNLNRKPAYYGVVSALENGKTSASTTSSATTTLATLASSSAFPATPSSVSTTPTLSSAAFTSSSVFPSLIASPSSAVGTTSLPTVISSPVPVSAASSASTSTMSTVSTTPISSYAIVNSAISSSALPAPTASGMTTSYIPLPTFSASSESLTTFSATTSSFTAVSSTITAESALESTASDSGDDEDDTCEY